MRSGRHRTTGVASGASARSATAGEYHCAGYARNLARKFRGRFNRTGVAETGSMKIWRNVACAVLLLVIGVSLAANQLAPGGYAKQYREAAGAPPSPEHWL